MPTLIIEHSDIARSDRLGAMLRDQGHRIHCCRRHAGDALPGDLAGIDAVISMGGGGEPDGVDDEMELLRDAHARALPIVGICLGSQILTRALGGEVGTLDGGIELGWHDVQLTPVGREDPLFAGWPWTSKQIHWHRYHATKLPDDARALAKSDRTPVQAWALGLRTYAFQFHPEANAQSMLRWADDDPADLREAGVLRSDLESQAAAHDAIHDRLAQRLFERMALVLMPVDRRFAGASHE